MELESKGSVTEASCTFLTTGLVSPTNYHLALEDMPGIVGCSKTIDPTSWLSGRLYLAE